MVHMGRVKRGREPARQLHQRIFNTSYQAADGEVPVWHPSVRFYRVYKDGQLAAHLYFDPYARPGARMPCTCLWLVCRRDQHHVCTDSILMYCLSSKWAAKRSTPLMKGLGELVFLARSSLRLKAAACWCLACRRLRSCTPQ